MALGFPWWINIDHPKAPGVKMGPETNVWRNDSLRSAYKHRSPPFPPDNLATHKTSIYKRKLTHSFIVGYYDGPGSVRARRRSKSSTMQRTTSRAPRTPLTVLSLLNSSRDPATSCWRPLLKLSRSATPDKPLPVRPSFLYPPPTPAAAHIAGGGARAPGAGMRM